MKILRISVEIDRVGILYADNHERIGRKSTYSPCSKSVLFVVIFIFLSTSYSFVPPRAESLKSNDVQPDILHLNGSSWSKILSLTIHFMIFREPWRHSPMAKCFRATIVYDSKRITANEWCARGNFLQFITSKSSSHGDSADMPAMMAATTKYFTRKYR